MRQAFNKNGQILVLLPPPNAKTLLLVITLTSVLRNNHMKTIFYCSPIVHLRATAHCRLITANFMKTSLIDMLMSSPDADWRRVSP